jgi:hypothetical protein
MYRRYLLKHRFWAITKKGSDETHSEPRVYMYHDDHIGGIYAYIQQRGILIRTTTEERLFENFGDLDHYLLTKITNSQRISFDIPNVSSTPPEINSMMALERLYL